MKYKISLRKRRLAIFLLITFLQSIVLPPVASALTSGPTAPETMSFEPVDVTDMVNLMTGDFTYNVPLLEVPGPEGGYPVSLSYHAGIKPLEDASWVGLGWNLSPGSINRSVNGYPDDHKDVERIVEDQWEGGTTTTYSVGVGIGVANGSQLGIDFTISNDTYRGFGGDVGISYMLGVGQKYGPNASFMASISTAGASAGFEVGYTTKIGVKLAAGLSTKFKGSPSASLKVSYKTSKSSVGLTMTSSGVKGSLQRNKYKANFQYNNKSGRISTRSWGVGFGIPLGIFTVNLGYSHTRYWMHETDEVTVNGVLHADNSDPGTLVDNVIQDEHITFDTYSLLQKDLNVADNPDPEWVQGGSFPAYDSYSVSGQGVGGNIQPYIFENGSLYRKQIRKGQNQLLDLSFYHIAPFTKKVNFRFINDFSNNLEVSTPPLYLDPVHPSTNPQIISADNTGFNIIDQHLAGSKHIEWYTNQEIINGTAPTLMEYPGLTNAQRTNFLDFSFFNLLDQMGGVSITNESGVTYHYALPVYTYGEYTFTQTINSQNGDSWNKQQNGEPYAYTWLLTAVTGPDYVDKNNNKQVDEEDWGYWVEFDYGRWADDYEWRTPSMGTFKDINEESETFSHGFKEIYYLDAIKTRSHTALFVKDIRKDGKSVTSKDDGGFLPKSNVYCVTLSGQPLEVDEYLPTSQMRLDKIMLFNNATLKQNNINLNTLRAHGELPGDLVVFNETLSSSCSVNFTKKFHDSDQVLDVSDLDLGAMVNATADVLETVELNNNHYDLCPETPNSFENIAELYNMNSVPGEKTGKLTLKSIKYKGRNDATIMPPLNFEYDYDDPSTYNFNVTSTTSMAVYGSTPDWEGEIVKYSYGGKDYYCLLKNYTGYVNFDIVQLGEHAPNSSHHGSSNLVRTKNAPFSASKYDYWGHYKPDFTLGSGISPSNVTRMPTTVSAKNTDVWSMRSIETSLGAKIEMEYENKHYEDNIWQKYDQINYTQAVTNSSATEIALSLNESIDFEDAFAVGDMVTITGFYTNPVIDPIPQLYFIEDLEVEVLGVTSTTLTVENPLVTNLVLANNGFLKFMRSGVAYGNGIRTKSITVNGDGDTRKTNYDYQDGCISYNPSSLELIYAPDAPNLAGYEKAFKEDLSYIIALARELPAPTVMYETINMSEEYNGLPVPGSKRYTFQVPKKEMVDVNYSNITYESTSGDIEELSKRTITIKDKTSQVGNLLQVETINAQGLVSNKITYDYTDDESGESESDYDQYNDQGIIHQAFHELRTKHTGNEDHEYIKGVVSVRQEFPSILKSTTETGQGFTSVTQNTAYDFYSGELTESETENQNGEFYRTTTIPAYKKYDDMGLMVHNIDQHHMLSQTAYTETAEIDDWDGNVINILSAGATTWNDQWTRRQAYTTAYSDINISANKEKVWRKHKHFIWKSTINPDGTLSSAPSSTNQSINWTTGTATASNWEEAITITRYDTNSKVLEEKDLDGNHAALKMGYDDTYVIAANGNAHFEEFTFSGAEDYDASTGFFGGEVRRGGGSIYSYPNGSDIPHTGQHMLALNNGEEGFLYKVKIGKEVEPFDDRGRRYRASVWWLPNGPGIDLDEGRLFYRIVSLSGTVLQPEIEVLTPDYDRKAGNWHQLNLDIEIPDGFDNHYLEVGVRNENSTAYELYFDDFRFYPMDAPFQAYVYDQLTGELTHVLDGNNMFTEYEYNDKGQLIRTYVETTENPKGKRLVTESDYHYKRPLD
ncbi:MAG: hypothetical protein AAGG75_23225 [Bacteroidota bacterium]